MKGQTLGFQPSQEFRRPAFGRPAFRYLRRLLEFLILWYERSRQRRHLAALDDRLLKDIGKSQEDARRESGKPFWR